MLVNFFACLMRSIHADKTALSQSGANGYFNECAQCLPMCLISDAHQCASVRIDAQWVVTLRALLRSPCGVALDSNRFHPSPQDKRNLSSCPLVSDTNLPCTTCR